MAESSFRHSLFKNPPKYLFTFLSWALIGFGPLCVGGAHGSEVSHRGRGVGRTGVSLPEHGVAGLGRAGEGARAVVQRSLVQGRGGQHDGAGFAADKRLHQTALRRPGPVVPAVLLQTVGQRGARQATDDGGAGTARARGDRGGAGGSSNWEVIVRCFDVIQTLDGDG